MKMIQRGRVIDPASGRDEIADVAMPPAASWASAARRRLCAHAPHRRRRLLVLPGLVDWRAPARARPRARACWNPKWPPRWPAA
jgi:predicted amidohydrolase